ncbi:hypothetical protein GCM10009623_16060 [Nocardioides aestuarii]|uniref:SRPBCC family protein n=1 Tax=Nocardioides aestuarii TaxID=252231 RepID=A0ABW4TKB9_9ACTN
MNRTKVPGDARGAVRLEEHYDTDPADLWEAITDPARLGRWLGEVSGDLTVGGAFTARFYASEWSGTGRVEACDAPRRLLVSTVDDETSDEGEIEVTLTADGDRTLLVLEERGLPLDLLAAYGAGNELHLQDLGDHVAGGPRRPADGRWAELLTDWQSA